MGVCRTSANVSVDAAEPSAACANVSANAARLAQPAQTSRQMLWYLRSLRKRLGKCRGTCATCANVSANAAELAQPAQTSRQMLRNLRSLRKRLGKCGGTCAACANVSANAAELARLAQTSWQMPQYLRGLRKRLSKCGGTCAACANVSANAAVLARPAQTSRQMPWYLRSLRKRPGMGKRSFRCRGVTLTPYRRPAGPAYVFPVFKHPERHFKRQSNSAPMGPFGGRIRYAPTA